MILSGCSDASPLVGILRSLDSLEFSPSHVVTSSLASVPLQAKCSSLIGTVEMSLDGGTTWMAPNAYDSASSSTCTNGKFNIVLSNLKAPWSGMSITQGQTMTVKFRAQPRPDTFFYKDVTVLYSPATSRSQEVLVGSSEQSGGGMRMKSRLRAQSQHIATGGSYKIQGRIAE